MKHFLATKPFAGFSFAKAINNSIQMGKNKNAVVVRPFKAFKCKILPWSRPPPLRTPACTRAAAGGIDCRHRNSVIR